MFQGFYQRIDKVNPLKFFLLLSGIFGLLFLFITPPFQGADEIVHFYRAYQISEGHLLSTQTNKDAGGFLPTSLGRVIAETNTPVIAFYPQNKYDEHATKHALSIDTGNERKFYSFPASATYSPTDYIGSSFGILVSRLIHLPTLVSLYAARMGNLLTWIVLAGIAIAWIPRRKWAFVSIALLPMSLFQASTLNGDPMTIGSLLVFVALILKFRAQTDRISRNQILTLTLVMLLMLLSKPVMFIFLPLLLLLHKKLFKSKIHRLAIQFFLAAIPLFVFVVWMYLIRGIDGSAAYSNKQNPSEQLDFILHSPQSFINVVWNTYFYTWGDSITRSFIGTFGWSDTPLSELLVTAGYIGLGILFVTTYEPDKTALLHKREKLLLWAVVITYILAISASLYLYYSPVGFKIIYGLQGRYFIPVAALIAVLAQSQSLKITRSLYHKVAVGLPVFLLVTSTITLYVRYFIKNV